MRTSAEPPQQASVSGASPQHSSCVCLRTHGGLAAGLVLLLVFLDAGGDEGAFSSRRGGEVLTAGGERVIRWWF